MSGDHVIRVSDDVGRADWIRERLRSPEQHVATSIVPDGFEAYVRVLHPAQIPTDNRGLVRWADVAAWADTAWHRRVQWHDVALPRVAPSTVPPWTGSGPRTGSPWLEDVVALADTLSTATTTPSRCFFALWAGYGSTTVGNHSYDGPHPGSPAPRLSPRLVTLPWREYVLFEGPLASVTSFAFSGDAPHHMPNLWWPEDHAWCVASEIDLSWTYVGASRATSERLIGDGRLEVLDVSADDSCLDTVSGWLAELVERATDDVIAKGSATLSLALGTVEVSLSGGRMHGVLSTRTYRPDGRPSGSSSSPVGSSDLHVVVRSRIEQTIIALTRNQ